MARPSLSTHEVALIKAMLQRGMRNNSIQFFFNRPDRPVNSGRITEIKLDRRWSEILPATNVELDHFLEFHDKDPFKQERTLPTQELSATTFSIGADGRIHVAPDPPGLAPASDIEQEAVYSELRQKTQDLLTAGHNILGATKVPLERFLESLSANMSEASMTIIWLRGNSLRSILRAHEEVKNFGDMHPDKLDMGVGERIKDVVEAFNVFVLGDAKGRALDIKRLGPEERATCDEAIQLANPIIENSHEIASESAETALREQSRVASTAPKTFEGDQVVGLARESSSNFVISVLRYGYDASKRILGSEFRSAWQYGRKALYVQLAAKAVQEKELIIQFVVRRCSELQSYVNTVLDNPTLEKVASFIESIFS